MGLTFVEATVTGPSGKSQPVKFLVDSGASYSLVPHDVWRDIELDSDSEMTFTLADGTTIDRNIAECQITLEGKTRHTPVILNDRA